MELYANDFFEGLLALMGDSLEPRVQEETDKVLEVWFCYKELLFGLDLSLLVFDDRPDRTIIESSLWWMGRANPGSAEGFTLFELGDQAGHIKCAIGERNSEFGWADVSICDQRLLFYRRDVVCGDIADIDTLRQFATLEEVLDEAVTGAYFLEARRMNPDAADEDLWQLVVESSQTVQQ